MYCPGASPPGDNRLEVEQECLRPQHAEDLVAGLGEEHDRIRVKLHNPGNGSGRSSKERKQTGEANRGRT